MEAAAVTTVFSDPVASSRWEPHLADLTRNPAGRAGQINHETALRGPLPSVLLAYDNVRCRAAR
jgi:hypothetical protein